MSNRLKPSERLFKRLKKEGYAIPEDAQFRRLYPGHWQRSSGAWVWTITGLGLDIGSCDTVKKCLEAKEWRYLENGEIVAETRSVPTAKEVNKKEGKL